MDRKSTREHNTYRPSRSRKRKFSGNKHTFEIETEFTSTSAKKLETSRDEEIIVDASHGYRIIEFLSVFTAISQFVVCKECHQAVRFCESSAQGLGFKIVITCDKCNVRYINSSPKKNKFYEINRRAIITMRLLGVGKEGINLFCGLMDICQGFSTNMYYTTLQNIHCAASAVFDLITKKAVKEEQIKNAEHGNNPSDLTVSGDGSWKKRGFSSLYGVVTIIGKYTNKILDLKVKSSYCRACTLWKHKLGTIDFDNWFENHINDCCVNHEGSVGKMEVDGILGLFSQSEEKFNVRYTKYIGDGDTKTFKTILDKKPYDDIEVIKYECVGYVQKRMGTRLRKVKKEKQLGGKNKLTDKLIKELTVYYGQAIRRHPDSVEQMYNAIWGTFYHKCSTDINPQHMYCPIGADSWCKWRQAEANDKLEEFKHDAPLHDDVAEAIKHIYEEFSNKNLLERCLGGNTQSNNESFNSTIWCLTPKHLNCGSKVIEISAYLAASIFNEGYKPILKILMLMGITIGSEANLFVRNRNMQRIKAAEIRVAEAIKEARTASREEQAELQAYFEEEEGFLYGPGIVD